MDSEPFAPASYVGNAYVGMWIHILEVMSKTRNMRVRTVSRFGDRVFPVFVRKQVRAVFL